MFACDAGAGAQAQRRRGGTQTATGGTAELAGEARRYYDTALYLRKL